MEGSLHIFDSVIHWSCWFLDLTFSVVSLWTEWLTSASWCMHRTGVFLLGSCGWPLASLLIPIILISDQWSQNSPCLSLLQTPQYGTEKRKRDELESSYLIANRKKKWVVRVTLHLIYWSDLGRVQNTWLDSVITWKVLYDQQLTSRCNNIG